MKFNITYMGDINFLNFQRDWLLLIAYGLQDLGHAVVISHNELDSGKTINIICHGVHNLAKDKVHHIINSNVNYGVIPGELIISRTINNRSQFDGESARVSTDFDNSYFPYLRSADFIWCVMEHNIKELPKYELKPSGFLRTIQEKGLKILLHDYDNPTLSFVRNSYINRSKIILNLAQNTGFRHMSGIRIVYLATNHCYGLCEYVDIDDGGYLKFSDMAHSSKIAEKCLEVIETKTYLGLAEEKHELIREFPMRNYLEELLDKTFGSG